MFSQLYLPLMKLTVSQGSSRRDNDNDNSYGSSNRDNDNDNSYVRSHYKLSYQRSLTRNRAPAVVTTTTTTLMALATTTAAAT